MQFSIRVLSKTPLSVNTASSAEHILFGGLLLRHDGSPFVILSNAQAQLADYQKQGLYLEHEVIPFWGGWAIAKLPLVQKKAPISTVNE